MIYRDFNEEQMTLTELRKVITYNPFVNTLGDLQPVVYVKYQQRIEYSSTAVVSVNDMIPDLKIHFIEGVQITVEHRQLVSKKICPVYVEIQQTRTNEPYHSEPIHSVH